MTGEILQPASSRAGFLGALCCLVVGVIFSQLVAYRAGYLAGQIVEVEKFHQKALAVHQKTVEELKAKHSANLDYLRAHCACDHEFEIQ